MKVTNLAGQRFGRLLVIERAPNSKRGSARWYCLCDCGSKRIVGAYPLRSGRSKSCGCKESTILKVGQRYGMLLVVKKAEETGIHFRNIWTCKCDCGNEVNMRGSTLVRGSTSCGCKQKLPRGVASFNVLLGSYIRSASKRNLAFELSKEYFEELTKGSCYYCGLSAKQSVSGRVRRANGDYLYNGIDRLDNSKGYVEGNVVSCCGLCNKMKSGLIESEFLTHIRKIYNHKFSGKNP